METFLTKTPIAHRGLHDSASPENSLAAYRKACEAGYPIETDIYLTSDKKLVVFHDDTLIRMTGDGRRVQECTLEELRSLKLAGTEEHVPSFEELLQTVNGRVPLLIEIKEMKGATPKEIARALSDAMEGYTGEYAVQSFQPFYVRAYKKLHPEIMCGILAGWKMSTKADPWIRRFETYLLSRLKLNFYLRPDFISYLFLDYEKCKRAQKFKKIKLGWTVRSDADEALARRYVDNIIFENYIPKT